MCSAHRVGILRDGLSSCHVESRGLTRRFGSKVAVHPFDLDLGPGGIIGLLGPNGSGKSTLLRMLLGLVRPDAGSARIDGVALEGDGIAVRRRVAYAPGEIAMMGEMRAGSHLDWLCRGREAEAFTRAREIAGELGLPLDARVRAYSHGMKRQLLLAAALAPRVPVRILDEATEGLDPTRRGEILARLQDDAANGTTILLSSHHLGEVDRVCDVLVFLNEGRKIAQESATSLAARARRLVRIGFEDGTDMRAVEATLARQSGARVRVEGLRASVALEGTDPAEFLARALAAPDLPRPRAAEYGELSLGDLYRELYGVEGC
ncbi:MAG: ATP-binding cassette domain-containing protein [Planctomycetota bacterium]